MQTITLDELMRDHFTHKNWVLEINFNDDTNTDWHFDTEGGAPDALVLAENKLHNLSDQEYETLLSANLRPYGLNSDHVYPMGSYYVC